MHNSLVILKQSILLLREVVRLQRNNKFMFRLRWGFHHALFGLMNSFQQIEVRITFSGFLA